MSGPSSNPGDPIAYFITWTTYGTWLSGDERGWRKKGASGTQEPNPWLTGYNQKLMKEDAYTLSAAERAVVEQTIRRHCEIRQWTLHAVNARSNHVHVVVTATAYSPDVVRDQLKAWCTRNLKAFASRRLQFWTEGAYSEKIYEEDDFEAAVLYVLEAQDANGRDGAEGG